MIKIKSDVGGKIVVVFEISGDGTLRYKGRLCVPDIDDLKQRIFVEVYYSCYVVHPGYKDVS